MDISGLKRDPDYIRSKTKVLSDGSTVATAPMEMMIPARFMDARLASMGKHIETVAIYALICDGRYAIDMTNALIRTKPSATRTTKVDDVEYLVLEYQKGDAVLMQGEVVTLDVLVYYIWSEMVDKGKTPWFISKEDKPMLLTTAKSYANINLGGNYSIIEMIMSVCMRSSKDLSVPWRYAVNKNPNADATFIGLRNIQHTTDTDLSRVGGSYPEIGLMAAISRSSETSEGLEQLFLM